MSIRDLADCIKVQFILVPVPEELGSDHWKVTLNYKFCRRARPPRSAARARARRPPPAAAARRAFVLRKATLTQLVWAFTHRKGFRVVYGSVIGLRFLRNYRKQLYFTLFKLKKTGQEHIRSESGTGNALLAVQERARKSRRDSGRRPRSRRRRRAGERDLRQARCYACRERPCPLIDIIILHFTEQRGSGKPAALATGPCRDQARCSCASARPARCLRTAYLVCTNAIDLDLDE
ncbi:hypothetical protein EVAR_92162_1 [Eumeta japonica]|uniref:Uncharacterized protein n=1 Tax=Eumeta variegata TaxID=151549 RepID=A0A4C1SZA1_EUMVA|nr:hypothetical protein EVAR_92162_1 [Eumeta japonica]